MIETAGHGHVSGLAGAAEVRLDRTLDLIRYIGFVVI